MKPNQDRIPTTHTGSLPRPDDLVAYWAAVGRGEGADRATMAQRFDEAVDAILQKQRDIGIDFVNDGEQSKPDYSTYIQHRLTGFEGETEVHPQSRDARDFPAFFDTGRPLVAAKRPSCTGPVAWKDFDAVREDVARMAAAAERAGVDPGDVFMTAVSPGQAARFLGNSYFPSHEEYVRALAGVLKQEYDEIAAAGFCLQLDCPDLASGWNNQFAEATLPAFRDVVRLHLDALDEATKDVPPERLRLHLCWGNYPGPHNHDIPLGDIMDLVVAARPTAFSFEGANPRHEHEWRVFEEVDLPEGKSIVPGVIDSVSNFVEHPRAVADRILRFAGAVGRERVIAGTDCGFATFAGSPQVHPTIAWAKLGSLVEGARIASAELWP